MEPKTPSLFRRIMTTFLAYLLLTLALGLVFALTVGKEVSTPAFRYVGF